jgi:5-methylcytosine-specific restriction endonuclease McrA
MQKLENRSMERHRSLGTSIFKLQGGTVMNRSLLLNCNGEPLQFIDGSRAIKLMLKDRVEVASGLTGLPSYWDDCINTPTREFRLPAVLRLKYYVNKRSYRKPPRFQKKVLFNRDSWKCQYCGIDLNYAVITVDHIQPASRGGGTTWKNCVAACRRCNNNKGNRTPEEAGMKLLKQPVEPNAFHYWDLSRPTSWHEDWSLFVEM